VHVPQFSSRQFAKGSIAILATIVLIRLLTLPFPDLVDSTEGRYGSVAKIMLDRNDWITPWINMRGVEVPYNGKPPLHFWLMQISYLLFGYTSFAARLPGVLSAIGIGVLLGFAGRVRLGITAGYTAAIIFASSTIAFFLAGAALLDTTLTLGTTMSIVGFLLAEKRTGPGSLPVSNVWGYVAFAGAGIGMLVKGPLAVVLPGLIVVPWMVILRYTTGKWPKQFAALPWIAGPLLFLVVAMPWYILAELKTPGFLEYFFISENFGRFFKKEYGDVYGSGHRQPFGAAWLMMIPALVPWSVMLLFWFAARYKQVFSKSSVQKIVVDPDLLFGVLWATCCPFLLLGARQYTGTYIMPSIPGFAFLGAVLWARFVEPDEGALRFSYKLTRGLVVLLAAVTFTGAIIGVTMYGTPGALAACVIAVAFLYVTSLYVNRAQTSPIKEIGRLAVCAVMTYALASVAWNNHISNNRSSRRVLELVASLSKPDAQIRVGFPVYFPFSSTFYGPLHQSPSLTIVNLEDPQIPNADVDVLVVRNRNEKELLGIDPTLSDKKLAEIGQWNVYRGTGNGLK
jgi:4-amino-4-deoxy-L-arabinose transferase-like glycosyltransferase